MVHKLTIEHLKGYLGTDLLGESLNGTIFEMDLFSSMGGKIEKREISTFINSKIKPLLYPLSTLKNKDLDNFCIDFKVALKSDKLDILSYANYYEIEYLYKHHFDIHGLIEKKLAIDKSKL